MNKNKIVKILRIVMPIIAVTTFVLLAPWDIVYAWILPLPDSVQEQLDEAVEKHGFEGILLYVDKKGTDPQFYAAGYHNRENKIPANPKALFKLASINKLYDAAAIAKLVASGKLSLEKTLAEYFPEFADKIENSDKINLKMMVQHRSGIPNITDSPNYWADPPETNMGKLELIFNLPAKFEPDTDYEYSNTNYLLIAMLIEKRLGYGKFQYIKEEILDPLNLKNTFGSLSDVNLDDLMSGYYVGINEDIKTNNYGAMIASAEDVGIFLRALNDGSVFNGKEKEIYSSIYVYEHTGLMPGYQSIARYHKDIDTIVIQFVNTTNFLANTFTVSEVVYSRVLKILRGE